MIGQARIDIERFDGKGDFNMWRKKMYVVLVHKKCAKALGGELSLPKNMNPTKKVKLMEIAYSLLILHLSNSVLRKVDNVDTIAKI